MQPVDAQDAANRAVYNAPGVVRAYHEERLTRAEAVVLLKHQPALMGRDVLDIGFGTGRTTAYLAPLARRYEGIDYSPVMVDDARRHHPQASLQLGDMRALEAKDASFDLVFGSNCVLDAVSHEDRLRTLAEFRRVLRPGGWLIFSSHNRAYEHALDGPRLEFARNPGTLLSNLLRYARQLGNRAHTRSLQRLEPDYALLSDIGHHFACLHYYVKPAVQWRQLRAAGFAPVEAMGHQGLAMNENEDSPRSPWVMYVARRA